jgi:hypothetical protein
LSGNGTAAAAQYSTDFSSYGIGSQPSDWTARWNTVNSSWTVQAGLGIGGKQLQGAQSSVLRRLLSWNVIPTNDGNIEILTKVMSHTTVGNSQGLTVDRICLRSSGAAGTETGYCAALGNYSGTYVVFFKFVNGAATIVNQTAFAWSTGSWYWVRYRANGTTHQIRAWADGVTEPGTWQISLTDADISAGGWTGVGTYDQTDAPYYDYFSVGTGGVSAPSPAGGLGVGSITLTQTSEFSGSYTYHPAVTGPPTDWGFQVSAKLAMDPDVTLTNSSGFAPATAPPYYYGASLSLSDTSSFSGTSTKSTTASVGLVPANYDFGNILLDGLTIQTFTLTHIAGSDPITVGTLALSGTDVALFGILNDNCSGQTLAGGASCTAQVTFFPTTVGAKSAILAVPTSINTFDVNLIGMGQLTIPPPTGGGSGGGSFRFLPW